MGTALIGQPQALLNASQSRVMTPTLGVPRSGLNNITQSTQQMMPGQQFGGTVQIQQPTGILNQSQHNAGMITNHQPMMSTMVSQPQTQVGMNQMGNSNQPSGFITVNTVPSQPNQLPSALILPNGQIIPVVTQPSLLFQGGSSTGTVVQRPTQV